VNPSVVRQLGSFLDDQIAGMVDEQEIPKYMTVNFRSIFTLGTVEFRTHRGTHNQDEILKWVDIILRLKDAACRINVDPRDTLDYQRSSKQLKEFLKDIWPPHYVEEMMHKDLHDEMTRSSFAARVILFPKMMSEMTQWWSSDSGSDPSGEGTIADMLNCNITSGVFYQPTTQEY
jgi:hypothetical protein